MFWKWQIRGRWINTEYFKHYINICPIDYPGFWNIWLFILGSIWNDWKECLTIEHRHTTLKKSFLSIVKFKALYSVRNIFSPKPERAKTVLKELRRASLEKQSELVSGTGNYNCLCYHTKMSPSQGRFLIWKFHFSATCLKSLWCLTKWFIDIKTITS